MMTKTAHAEASKALAAIDRVDARNAFEYGVIKAASDLPLTDEQRRVCYAHAMKLAAK